MKIFSLCQGLNMELCKKLRICRKDAGLSQEDASRQLNISTRTLQNYEYGTQVPNLDILKNIAKLYNVSMEYFLKDEELTQKNNYDEDTIYIPYFTNAKVSAGFGEIQNDNSNDCEFLPFQKQNLRDMFKIYNVDKLYAISCIGNSMMPTINEGEKIIFQNDGSFIEGAIYVIRKENELFVKRISKSPLMLISDNAQYEPIKIKNLEEIEILGRVIGSYDIRVKNF